MWVEQNKNIVCVVNEKGIHPSLLNKVYKGAHTCTLIIPKANLQCGQRLSVKHGNCRDAPTKQQIPWIEISPPSSLMSKSCHIHYLWWLLKKTPKLKPNLWSFLNLALENDCQDCSMPHGAIRCNKQRLLVVLPLLCGILVGNPHKNLRWNSHFYLVCDVTHWRFSPICRRSF